LIPNHVCVAHTTTYFLALTLSYLLYQLDQKYQQRAGGAAGGSGEQLTPAELNARFGYTEAMQQQQYTEQMRRNQLQLSQQRVPGNTPAYYAAMQQQQQQQLIIQQQRAEMQRLANQQAQDKQQLQLRLQSTLSQTLAAQGATDGQIYHHLKRELDLQTEKHRQELLVMQARHSVVAQQTPHLQLLQMQQQQQQLLPHQQLLLQQQQQQLQQQQMRLQQQQQQQIQLQKSQQQQLNQQQLLQRQQQQKQQQTQPQSQKGWKEDVTNADRMQVMRRIQVITSCTMKKLQILEHAYIMQSTNVADYMSEEKLKEFLLSKA
jgi:hypothetical protein